MGRWRVTRVTRAPSLTARAPAPGAERDQAHMVATWLPLPLQGSGLWLWLPSLVGERAAVAMQRHHPFVSGSATVNVVPDPTVLCASIAPPCACTIQCASANPSPVTWTVSRSGRAAETTR